MKRTYKFSTAVAIVLATLLIAATSFAATQYFRGFVSWDGEFTPFEEQNSPQPTPTPIEISESDSPVNPYNILVNIPADEYWEVWTSYEDGTSPENGRYGVKSVELYSVEELNALLEGEPSMPLPTLPEGYEVEFIQPLYNTVLEECYSVEKLDGNTSLLKYKTSLNEELPIRGYSFYATHGDSDSRLTVNTRMYKTEEPFEDVEYALGLDEGETFTVIEVPGFDNALHFIREDGSYTFRMKDGRDGEWTVYVTVYCTDPEFTVEDLIVMIGDAE